MLTLPLISWIFSGDPKAFVNKHHIQIYSSRAFRRSVSYSTVKTQSALVRFSSKVFLLLSFSSLQADHQIKSGFSFSDLFPNYTTSESSNWPEHIPKAPVGCIKDLFQIIPLYMGFQSFWRPRRMTQAGTNWSNNAMLLPEVSVVLKHWRQYILQILSSLLSLYRTNLMIVNFCRFKTIS